LKTWRDDLIKRGKNNNNEDDTGPPNTSMIIGGDVIYNKMESGIN
jgi:hypothetical protein